jgi:hypothetical protein
MIDNLPLHPTAAMLAIFVEAYMMHGNTEIWGKQQIDVKHLCICKMLARVS